uniref:polymorphic toxin-type HINT domain-containing protein n=1 Tax=Hamadaea tsunoensis TaxID=53368 RepID=UPI0004859709
SIGNVQVYQRAITAAEASTLYGNGLAGRPLGDSYNTTTYTYDQRGLQLSETDPLGNRADYAYDENDNLVITTGPAVNVETNGGTPVSARPVTITGFDTFGDEVEVQDASGQVTRMSRDASGRLVKSQQPSYTPPGSSTPITPTASATYDGSGQLLTQTDQLGKTTTYVYDQLGRTAKVTLPNGGVVRNVYDLDDNLLQTTNAVGAYSQATYDFVGRTTSETQTERSTGQAFTTQYAYAPSGYLQKVTQPSGAYETYTYNNAGDRTTATDAYGNTTTYQYDYLGRESAVAMPDGSKRTSVFDEAGNEIAVKAYSSTGALISQITSGYDGNGNRLSATDALGHTTSFTYDATGFVTGETQPISATGNIVTSFGYDLLGHRTRYTDGRGNKHITTYNTLGLTESQIEPATATDANDRTWTTSYDAAAQPVKQTMPGGVTLTSAYDDLGNLIGQTGSGADAATADRTFGYDLAGHLTSAKAGTATETFTYNDRGALATASGASGASTFGYTADGLLASRQDAAGTSTYAYDNADRLVTVNDGSTGQSVTYGYDSLSRLTKATYGASGYRAYTYDAASRLASDTLKTSANATVASVSYGYDLNGRETSKTTTGFAGSATNTYTYDWASRLLSWNNGTTTTTYAYDASGNRTQMGGRTLIYDERDELTGDGQKTYTYTPRGTMASAVASGSTETYASDAYGQQTRIATQNYTYDGLGRVLTSGSTTLAYSGAENDVASDGAATYSRDPDGDVVGVKAGTAVFAWTDQHTDVVGQFTAAGTALTGSTAYDPFGNVLATAAKLGNLGFQSEWTDPATARVNMLSRWYDPAIGAFDNRDTADNDPVPDSIDANRYQYGDGDPLLTVDPTGHWGWNPIKAIKKAVKKVSHAVSHYASSSFNYAAMYAHSAWHATTHVVHKAVKAVKKVVHKVKKAVHRIARAVKHAVHRAVHYVRHVVKKATHWVKHTYQRAKHWVGKQVNHIKQKVKQAYHRVKQAAAHVVQKVAKAAKSVAHAVKDAYNASATWVKEHKDAIIQIGAIVAGVAAGLACTAVTGGVGAAACAVGAAALINLGKDAATGNIHSFGDALGSLGQGALQGGIGLVTGGVGGVVAGKLAGAMGGFAAKLGGRMVSGFVAGAVGDIGAQLIGTGHVNWTGVAIAGGIGAVMGGRASSCHSFDPSTRVLMADGTTKAIKDVKIGDEVMATDPVTGKSSARPVTALYVNHDTDLADVTVKDAATGRTAVLRTTQHHPFWSRSAKAWVLAAALVPATMLQAAPTTAYAAAGESVVSVRSWTGGAEMRDLTVDVDHTYYVVAGTTPILVHNNNAACVRPTFVADSRGTVVPTSASRLEGGLQAAVDAGEPGFSTFPVKSAGTGFQLPDGSRIRVMQPSANGNAGLRASFTNGSDAPVSPFTGKPVQPPKGVNSKQYVRERTHIELEP